MFTQPDNVIQGLYNPQALNHYSFERNNPYKHIDPNGHTEVVTATVAITGVVLAIGVVYLGSIVIGPGGRTLGEAADKFITAQAEANNIVSAYDTLKSGVKYLLDDSESNKKDFYSSVASLAVDLATGNFLGGKYGIPKGDIVYSASTPWTPQGSPSLGGLLVNYANRQINLVRTDVLGEVYSEEVRSGGGGNTRGIISRYSSRAREDLIDKSSNNKNSGKTNGDIIREWRKEWYGR